MSEYQELYGLPNASESLEEMHETGIKIMGALLKQVESPHEEKILRTWGITEAAEMIGRTPQHLRKIEIEGSDVGPHETDDKGKRIYTLERINHIRKVLGTQYYRPENTDPIVLAVSNFKGGCAKTTTSVNLAQKCALEGFRVLLLDLDPQATATLLMGIIPDIHLNYEDTIAEALITDPAKIHDVIRTTYFHGLDLIPSNLAIQDAEFALPNHQLNNRDKLGSPVKRLNLALNLIKDQYDMIIMDCGPNTGSLTVNAIASATGMLVPIPPVMENFGSFVTFTSSLSALCHAVNSSLDFFRILLTKTTSSIESRMVSSMIRGRYSKFTLENSMVSTVEIEKASAQLSTVYELNRPIKSAKAYRRCMESLDAVNNEIIDIFKQVWKGQSVEKHVEQKVKEDAVA